MGGFTTHPQETFSKVMNKMPKNGNIVIVPGVRDNMKCATV